MLPRAVLQLSPLLAPELESLYVRHAPSLGEAHQQQLEIGVLEPERYSVSEATTLMLPDSAANYHAVHVKIDLLEG